LLLSSIKTIPSSSYRYNKTISFWTTKKPGITYHIYISFNSYSTTSNTLIEHKSHFFVIVYDLFYYCNVFIRIYSLCVSLSFRIFWSEE
jgi:hypothetical protein